MELIKTNLSLCEGCNRCVRECPMETANITYQDCNENVKVEVDHSKCIVCGRCFSVCKHNARYFADDTERFFDDLAKGVPISVIAAPAIRTNMPEWQRLFTWLRQLGAKKIYDVSLGADICIWGHIRYVEQNKSDPVRLITQPCPPIVSYCEIYKQELLKNLSPIHSPMGCVSVYMKEYEGVTDNIAALSPCVAKAKEFSDTGLAQYNITFSHLIDYISNRHIELPREQTGFDHDESGLGSIFPVPGGLKENIEFFTGKSLSIDKAEGKSVYEMLDIYEGAAEEMLPDIFDVLNCREGCNVGPACSHYENIFEINREMDKKRDSVKITRKREVFDDLHKKFDARFDLSKFMRKYKPVEIALPEITGEDIEEAFALLDKTDSEKQHTDCGACGSETCFNMARKIALGVNIPKNCIVKAIADAKNTEKMHEADDRIRIMLDSCPIGAHFWDENSNLVDCNQAAAKLFGLSDKQEYMKKYFELTPEYQPDGSLSMNKLRETIDKAYQEGYIRLEWMRRALDGEPIPVELTLVRVDYKGANLIASYCRDLRNQKQKEKELELAYELNDLQLTKLDMAVKATKIGLWDMNVVYGDPLNEENVVVWSDEFRQMLGYNDINDFPDTVESFHKCLHPDDLERVPRALIAHLMDYTGGTPYDIEYRVIKKNGETAYIRANCETIRDGNGKPVFIAGSAMDITETKKQLLENELQLTKLDLVVKASKIGLWDMEVIPHDPVNPNNVFIWSDEFRQMLGFSDKTDFPDILGSWSTRLHPDDLERTVMAFDKHMTDTTGKTPYDIEYRLKKKNGEYAYYRASGETIRAADGSPIRVAGALVDITDTKNLLLDTERHRIEAEAANQAKSAFLSTMSHEIRTPLNAILGITEIQLQSNSLEESTRNSLEKIYTSGDMLLGIINDILDLSKIEAGKLELVIGKYETASLISDTAQLNMMRIGSKQIEFELHIDEKLPTLLSGDELRVKQILNNLLSNAFKYTKEGTVTMSVSSGMCEGEEDNINLIVKVSDTGQGMTKEQVDKLFEEYSRFNLETNRSTEGTGLGMNITRNLVRMMNGEIFVESEPGKGSVFTVHLPQGRINSDVLGKEMADNLHKFRTNSRSQMKRVQIVREPMPYGSVLVVDDVETNIFVAKGLLTPYELKIDSADSGYAAIEKIKNGSTYDIIFMDHMMPGMDGVETTKKLREMGYAQSIVALTANAVSGQSEIFLKNGFNDFISKPIDVYRLNDVLNKLILDKQTPETLIKAADMRRHPEETPASASAELDPQFVEIITRDVKKSIEIFDEFIGKGGNHAYSEDEMRLYVIHAHGMKSALANAGSMELSAVAMKLEQLGRDNDIGKITAETPGFLSSLREFVNKLKPSAEEAEVSTEDEDKEYLTEMLLLIKAACEEYDDSAAEEKLKELREKAWTKKTKELLEKIAEQLLHSDFDEIAEAISGFIQI